MLGNSTNRVPIANCSSTSTSNSSPRHDAIACLAVELQRLAGIHELVQVRQKSQEVIFKNHTGPCMPKANQNHIPCAMATSWNRALTFRNYMACGTTSRPPTTRGIDSSPWSEHQPHNQTLIEWSHYTFSLQSDKTKRAQATNQKNKETSLANIRNL